MELLNVLLQSTEAAAAAAKLQLQQKVLLMQVVRLVLV
jgi:hypothetical protein